MSRLRFLIFAGVLLFAMDSLAVEAKEPAMFKTIESWVNGAISTDTPTQENSVLRQTEPGSEGTFILTNIFKPSPTVAVSSSSAVAPKPSRVSKGFFERARKEIAQAVEFAKEKVSKYMDESGLGSEKAYQAQKKIESRKSKIEKLNNSLPNYSLGGQESVGNDILNIQKSLTHTRFSGSQPGKRIPLSASKTQSDEIVRVVKIPKAIEYLDVGSEPVIKRIELPVQKLYVPSNGYELAKRLRSPELTKNSVIEKLKIGVVDLKPVTKVASSEIKVPQAVTEKKINKIALVAGLSENPIKETDFHAYTKNELELLAAQLIGKSGHCHITTGLFDRMKNRSNLTAKVKLEVAQCAYKMGLFRSAVGNVVGSLKSLDHQEASIKLILKDYPKSYESKLAKSILSKSIPSNLNKDEVGRFHYLLAKYHFSKKKYNSSLAATKKIPVLAGDYEEGQLLKSINQEILGQEGEAIKTLNSLYGRLKKRDSKNKDLKIITGINLSRIYYQKGQYKKAYQAQLGINKNHNLWIRAMIEQGWIQISANDFSGAIGNMYSIQSPYFKSVYKPESFAIRAIGYLNICQYGDAYSSLVILEKEYRPWMKAMKNYRKKNHSALTFYKTIASYLRGKSSATVDGIPYQVARELASQKKFLNLQAGINERFEEIDQWRFLKTIIAKDIGKIKWYRSKAKQRVSKIRSKIAKAKKNKGLKKNLPEWKGSLRSEIRLIGALEFKLKKYVQGQKQFRVMEKMEKKRLRKEVASLKKESGQFLRSHMSEMVATLNRVLENNEYLRFEIFSGSGENIRYRVSGGVTKKGKRIPAHIKPKKHLNWNFDGEYWEDEIGSYRSNLTNNCPQVSKYVNTMNQ